MTGINGQRFNLKLSCPSKTVLGRCCFDLGSSDAAILAHPKVRPKNHNGTKILQACFPASARYAELVMSLYRSDTLHFQRCMRRVRTAGGMRPKVHNQSSSPLSGLQRACLVLNSRCRSKLVDGAHDRHPCPAFFCVEMWLRIPNQLSNQVGHDFSSSKNCPRCCPFPLHH